MKQKSIALAATLALAPWGAAFAAPAATVLFAQPGSSIVDEAGVSRAAKRGDVVQVGERLVTAPNSISQVAMPDGSLVGVRAGSELKFELPAQAADRARQAVSLVQGAVRVIGAELMDNNKLSTLVFRSGDATLQMRGADLETARVVGKPRDGSTAAEGSYSRLLTGTASIGTGQTVTALAPRQVSYVAPASLTPVVTTSISPTLFTSTVLTSPTLSTTTLKTTTTLSTTSISSGTLSTATLSPTLTTSTLTSPLVTSKTLGTAYVAPTTTYVAPTLNTTTIAPITTTAFVAPTTTYVAPITTTYIAPITTTYIAPITTTYIAPVTTSTITKSLSTTTLTKSLSLTR